MLQCICVLFATKFVLYEHTPHVTEIHEQRSNSYELSSDCQLEAGAHFVLDLAKSSAAFCSLHSQPSIYSQDLNFIVSHSSWAPRCRLTGTFSSRIARHHEDAVCRASIGGCQKHAYRAVHYRVRRFLCRLSALLVPNLTLR